MKATIEGFRQVMSHFATGVTVVTTRTVRDTAYGVTVNSFTSVSLDPLLVLICLDNESSGLEEFKAAGWFGVNILSEDQKDVSIYFATRGSDRTQGMYETGERGVPLLREAIATLECRIVQIHPAGDHSILLAEVLALNVSPTAGNQRPLLFYRSRYGF